MSLGILLGMIYPRQQVNSIPEGSRQQAVDITPWHFLEDAGQDGNVLEENRKRWDSGAELSTPIGGKVRGTKAALGLFLLDLGEGGTGRRECHRQQFTVWHISPVQ
jgi:hypothetical protein